MSVRPPGNQQDIWLRNGEIRATRDQRSGGGYGGERGGGDRGERLRAGAHEGGEGAREGRRGEGVRNGWAGPVLAGGGAELNVFSMVEDV